MAKISKIATAKQQVAKILLKVLSTIIPGLRYKCYT